MTIGVTVVDHAVLAGGGLSSFGGSSVTPPGSQLYIVGAQNLTSAAASAADSTPLSCTGWGLTWTVVDTEADYYGPSSTAERVTVFQAFGRDPTGLPGAITLHAAGSVAQNGWGLSVLALSNAATIRPGSSVKAGSADSTNIVAPAMGGFADPQNVGVAFTFHGSNEGTTPSSGWTTDVDDPAGFYGCFHTQHRVNDPTVDASWASVATINSIVAVEVEHNRGGKIWTPPAAIPRSSRF